MRKNIFKYAFMAACATVLLAACSKEEKIEVGDWNSTSDYAVVSFVETNKTIELDPTESTTYTMHMGRRNPELSEAIEAEEKRVEELLQQDGLSKEDSTKLIEGLEESIAKMSKANLPAIEVPIVITDDGGNETFTISSAKFEEGEWLGKYTISFPKAEVGTTYTVQYAVKDPQFVSYYSSDVTATFSVTRVKWVSVGKADFHDWYYFEDNSEVEVLMKDGDPTMFRIMHPYDIIAAGAQSVPSSDYVELNLLKVGQTLEGVKITQPDLVYFTPIHTGYVHPSYGAEVVAWHPADLYASPSEDLYLKSYVMGYQKKTIEGKEYTIPGAINLAPYYYMSGVGGWNATSLDPGSRIIFDGFKLQYEADIFTEGDFEWEPVFEGALTSTKLEQSGTGVLYKGKCVATTDDADKRFEEAYGTPYLFKEPYAEGYDIVFFVKNGRISIPKDYAEAFEYQETGLEAAKEPIYAKINPSSSSFADNEVILDIDFVFLDNEGNATTFAKEKLTLAYITWSKVATGTFYYVMFSDTDDPEPDPGYSLYKRDDKDNIFKIGEWLMGTDFMFTWDKTSNKCVVLEQAINYEHPSYGPMYIMEGADYSDSYAEHTSYYDPATKIFHFFPAYFVEAGSFGQVEEFFEITEEGGVKQLVPAWNNAKLKAKDRKPGMWQGCIVSKKASNREIKVIKKAGKKEFESVKQAGNGTFAF